MAALEEVRDVRRLAALVGVSLEESCDQDCVLSLLMTVSSAAEYLQMRVEIPENPPGVLQMLVPKTRIFFNVERCKELRGDAIVALAVFASTQSTPAAFFAASVRKLHDNVSVLTDDEAEVVRDFFVLSGGRPYERPIDEAALRPRFAQTLVPLDDVLDQLERRDVIAKRRDGKLILVH